jgi:hypothetical protein
MVIDLNRSMEHTLGTTGLGENHGTTQCVKIYTVYLKQHSLLQKQQPLLMENIQQAPTLAMGDEAMGLCTNDTSAVP